MKVENDWEGEANVGGRQLLLEKSRQDTMQGLI